MGRAQQQAHDVRCDQADEAHDARDRHARPDREGHLRHQAAFQPLDVDADMARLTLAQGQGVEQVGDGQQCRNADGQHDKGGRDGRPRHGAEAAHRPEDQGAQLLLVGHEHQHADTGRSHGIDGDAGQQKRADQGDAFARGDAIDDDRRGKAAEERRHRQAPGPQARRHDVEHLFTQHDHRHRGQCRAARDAEQAGVGERVAEQALHCGTSGGEGGSHGKGRDHARCADGVEHCGRRVVERRARQSDGRQELVETDRERADAERARHAYRRRESKKRQCPLRRQRHHGARARLGWSAIASSWAACGVRGPNPNSSSVSNCSTLPARPAGVWRSDGWLRTASMPPMAWTV